MRLFFPTLLTFFLVSGCSSFYKAPPLSGKIIDQEGHPIPDALILVVWYINNRDFHGSKAGVFEIKEDKSELDGTFHISGWEKDGPSRYLNQVTSPEIKVYKHGFKLKYLTNNDYFDDEYSLSSIWSGKSIELNALEPNDHREVFEQLRLLSETITWNQSSNPCIHQKIPLTTSLLKEAINNNTYKGEIELFVQIDLTDNECKETRGKSND
tara:strand:- start:526 stop:1158 length:633 start_codon:yes stop_codon:yes gene_type:complete